jgi:hypothetical protein
MGSLLEHTALRPVGDSRLAASRLLPNPNEDEHSGWCRKTELLYTNPTEQNLNGIHKYTSGQSPQSYWFSRLFVASFTASANGLESLVR